VIGVLCFALSCVTLCLVLCSVLCYALSCVTLCLVSEPADVTNVTENEHLVGTIN
jgi:hypothetical protein